MRPSLRSIDFGTLARLQREFTACFCAMPGGDSRGKACLASRSYVVLESALFSHSEPHLAADAGPCRRIALDGRLTELRRWHIVVRLGFSMRRCEVSNRLVGHMALCVCCD